MTNRRQAIGLATGIWVGALAVPMAAWCQPKPARVPRVGFLISESLSFQSTRIDALRSGLAEFGLVDGKSIVVEIRSAEGYYERLPGLATELSRLNVDVIVAFGIKALTSARAATSTVPIVIPATSSDLVAMGFASSLARPGGNVTGSMTFGPEIMAKRLELLKELRPGTSRVGVLVNPANVSFGPANEQMNAAAKTLKLSLIRFDVKAPGEFDAAFAAMARGHVQSLVVQDDTLFGDVNSRIIAKLAARQGLTSVGSTGFAEAGGTVGYGRSDVDLYRRGAYFVDRILKGLKPSDLPIEQATRFELLVNMKSVRSLGIKVPPSVSLRADRAIE